MRVQANHHSCPKPIQLQFDNRYIYNSLHVSFVTICFKFVSFVFIIPFFVSGVHAGLMPYILHIVFRLFVLIPHALQYDGTSNFGHFSLIFCFSVTYDCLKCLWLMFCLSKLYQSRHHPNFPVWKYISEFNLHKMYFQKLYLTLWNFLLLISSLQSVCLLYHQVVISITFVTLYMIIVIVLPSES